MSNIDVYGYPHSERGKQGVPSANDVLGDPGHDPETWGQTLEGIGPSDPMEFKGVNDQALEFEGTAPGERLYANDGTSKIWKGVPSARAL